jgi:hypothetical protein
MVASVYAARLKKIQITNEGEEKEIKGSGPIWFPGFRWSRNGGDASREG